MRGDQHEVERQQQSAAEVPQGPATRRHPVAFVRGGYLHQQRVVHDQGRPQEDVADEQQHRAELPMCAGDEEHGAGGEAATPGEAGEHILLAPGPVSESTDHREHDR
jgi:hypothetical protein